MKFPLLNIDGSKSESIDISDKLVKLKKAEAKKGKK